MKKQTGEVIKHRIVFDASSHEKGSPSLNDDLETGPNLLPEILATLLRFRRYPKAVVSDRSQAFLQLGLNENDCDLTRFLWYHVNLETIEISAEQPRTMSEKDSSLLFQFHASHSLKDRRRVISLLRKDYVSLSSNYHHAEKRFHALAVRFERDETLRNVYHNQMLNCIIHEQV
jgi:hypothetical protein